MLNTSVLIYSCDKYSDVWEPFFTLFFRYWECPFRVYIATESKKCFTPGVTTINGLGTWTERMQKAVREIPTKYVIGMCEDFFFRRKVKQDLIEKCIRYTEHDYEAGCFNFEKECEPDIKLLSSEYENFGIKPPGHHFQKSCMPTLWRRGYLERLLDCKLDPWNWEWQEREYPMTHYIWTGSLKDMAFDYGLTNRNPFGIVQGRWVREDVVPLFQKEGIDVDYQKRGFV